MTTPPPRTQIKLCDVRSASYTCKTDPGRRPDKQTITLTMKDKSVVKRVVPYNIPCWSMRQAQMAIGEITMSDSMPHSEDALNHFAFKPIPFGDDVELVYDDQTRAWTERQRETMRVVGNLPELFQACRSHTLTMLNNCPDLDEEDMERMRVICSAYLRIGRVRR